MKLKKRWALVFALAGAQLVCLLAAIGWYGNWLRTGLLELMRGQMAAVQSQVTAQLAEVVEQWGIRDISPGTQDWSRMQSLIERIHLPNRGSLFIVDRKSGEVICHRGLRQGVELRKVRPAPTLFAGKHGAPDDDATRSGWVQMPDGTHYVTVHDIPQLGILLVADQRADDIGAAIAYVSRPLWIFGAVVSLVLVLLTCLSSAAIVRRYENKLESINANLERIVERRSRALVNTRDAVIFGLAKLAESRDTDTGEHLERIREYVGILARRLARHDPYIDEQYINTLEIASSLHDIGKVGVPDNILLKPGRLTPEERELMQQHTTIGSECLRAIGERLGEDDFLEMAREIAAAHHERWDGTGYPRRLDGDNIPLSARIVAVADVYDALRTKRVYKAAFSHEDAYREIVSGSGSHFDPEVVAAFMAVEDEMRAVAPPPATSDGAPPANNRRAETDIATMQSA